MFSMIGWLIPAVARCCKVVGNSLAPVISGVFVQMDCRGQRLGPPTGVSKSYLSSLNGFAARNPISCKRLEKMPGTLCLGGIDEVIQDFPTATYIGIKINEVSQKYYQRMVSIHPFGRCSECHSGESFVVRCQRWAYTTSCR